MTLADAIYERSQRLSEPAAREVLDFIDFLGQRYGTVEEPANPEYEAWLRTEIQKAIDDPRPAISHQEVAEQFARRREALAAQLETKK